MYGKKATNPCRCGYLDDPGRACTRAPRCAVDYQSKISGPVFDRIDLHVEVPAVTPADLALPPPAERSADVAARIAAARGYHRVLRVARTLADLDGNDGVTRVHVAEALAYRRIVPGRNALLIGA